jgi:hypothetical protein
MQSKLPTQNYPSGGNRLLELSKHTRPVQKPGGMTKTYYEGYYYNTGKGIHYDVGKNSYNLTMHCK